MMTGAIDRTLVEEVVPETSAAAASLPPRYPVAGILASATTYEEVTNCVVEAARTERTLLVAATSVHGVAHSHLEPSFGAKLNAFDIITPDGQPVRWALNLLHGAGLVRRVYGPTLMLHICEAAARQGLSVYLYGSTTEILERLSRRLTEHAPGLQIAGYHSPPFRPLTTEEDVRDAEAIRASGAQIVFVGLGCPRQEAWAYRQRSRLSMPLVCVGAAFDLHAGAVQMAPRWMQDHGLEWLFRVTHEPRRLWRRYATYPPIYVVLIGRQLLQQGLRRSGP